MKRGSVRKAWITTSVFTVRPYNKVSVNKYFLEIKPLMILLRAIGRLPYSFDKHGFAPFKLLSFPMLYTVVFITIQSYWTIYTLHVIIFEKMYNASSYDEIMFWMSLSLILLLNLTTPITKWVDSRKHAHFVSCWHDFQDNHMNSELEMNLMLPIKVFAVLILPLSIIFTAFETYLLAETSIFIMAPFTVAISASMATLTHWCATLYELRVAARVLLRKIILNGCRQMSTFRRSWLELSKLVSAVGESHAHTGMLMSVVFFVSLVLSTYALLSNIFEVRNTSNHFWGLLGGAFIGFLCSFILYDAAHQTTQEVGPDFSSKILEMDMAHLNQVEINEISLLLQTMSAHPPLVEYRGFVTINRNLFLSTITNAVTYLVVLVQFKASSPLNQSR